MIIDLSRGGYNDIVIGDVTLKSPPEAVRHELAAKCAKLWAAGRADTANGRAYRVYYGTQEEESCPS